MTNEAMLKEMNEKLIGWTITDRTYFLIARKADDKSIPTLELVYEDGKLTFSQSSCNPINFDRLFAEIQKINSLIND